jgi:hypothetical protein
VVLIAIALAIAGGEERALYQGRQLLLHVSRANGARAQHTALPSRTVRSAVPAPPWSAAAAVAPHEHIKGEQRCCTDAQVDCARAPGHTRYRPCVGMAGITARVLHCIWIAAAHQHHRHHHFGINITIFKNPPAPRGAITATHASRHVICSPMTQHAPTWHVCTNKPMQAMPAFMHHHMPAACRARCPRRRCSSLNPTSYCQRGRGLQCLCGVRVV